MTLTCRTWGLLFNITLVTLYQYLGNIILIPAYYMYQVHLHQYYMHIHICN